jgi:hypothetical protein
MSNTFKTIDKLNDVYIGAFTSSMPMVALSNTMPLDMVKYPQTKHNYMGNDNTIIMRRTPRPKTFRQDFSNITDGSTVSAAPIIDKIQQETISLLVNQNFSSGYETSFLENFWLYPDSQRNKLMKNYFLSMKEAVEGYIYYYYNYNNRYFIGDPSSQLSSLAQLSNYRAFMVSLSMPSTEAFLIISPEDMSAFAQNNTTNIYQPKISSEVWLDGVLKGVAGVDLFEDYNVSIHQSGTASGNTGLTLNADVSDGDTTIEITGLTVGETIKVGDKIPVSLQATGGIPSLRYVNPISKSDVSNNLCQFHFIVGRADSSNADYTETVNPVTGIIEGVYTASATTMTLTLSETFYSDIINNRVAFVTSDFGSTGTIPSGTAISVLTNHYCGMGGVKNQYLYFAAPAPKGPTHGATTYSSSLGAIGLTTTLFSGTTAGVQQAAPYTAGDAGLWGDKVAYYGQCGQLVNWDFSVGLITGPTSS